MMSISRPAVSVFAFCLSLATFEPFFGQEPSAVLREGVQGTPGKSPAEKQAFLYREAVLTTYSDPVRIGELFIIKNFLDNCERMKSARARPYAQFAPVPDPQSLRAQPRTPHLPITESYNYYLKNPRALQEALEGQLAAYREKAKTITAGDFYLPDPDRRYKLMALACEMIGPQCTKPMELVNWVVQDELAPGQQHQFEAERRQQRDGLEEAVKTIQKAALADEFLREVIVDPFVGVESGVDTQDSTETILKKRGDVLAKRRDELAARRATATGELLGKVLDLVQRLDGQQQEILSRFARIEKGEAVTADELDNLNRKYASIQGEIARLLMPGPGGKADPPLDPAEREALNRALQSTVGLMTTLIGTQDAKAARTFNAVASSGVQLVNVLESYRANKDKTGPEVASRVLTLDVVSIVTNLAGAMFQALSSQPSMDQLIYEQVIELRKQIQELGGQMHDRFDAVDRALGQIYNDMVKEFHEIKQDQREMRKSLGTVAASLGAMHDRLAGHESRLRDYLDALADRHRADEIAACLRHADHYTSDLSAAAFERCLAMLHACAVRDAGDALASGTHPRGGDLDADLLSRGLRACPERELRFLSALAERYGFRGLADGDSLDTPRPLNPLLWGESARRYVRMGLLYPAQFRRLIKRDPESGRYAQLAEIIDAGVDARNALRRIATSPAGEGASRPNVEPMRRLFREYADALREFGAAAEARRDELRRDRSIGETPYKIAGREPLLGPGQPEPDPDRVRRPKFKVGSIMLSDALREAVPNDLYGRVQYGDFGRLALDPPEGIEALIPVEFRHAHEMGLGTVKVCFVQAELAAGPPKYPWNLPPTPIPIGVTWEDAKQALEPRFIIQAEFYQGGQLKGVIFRRTLRVRDGFVTRPFPVVGGDYPAWARHWWTYGCRDRFMAESVDSGDFVRNNPGLEQSVNLFQELGLAHMEKHKKDDPFTVNLRRWTTRIQAQLAVPCCDVTSLRPQLRAALATAHGDLVKQLHADIDAGCLRKSADHLTAARTKFETLLSLGWPEAMRADPILLSLFKGKHGLPAKDEMMEAYQRLPFPPEAAPVNSSALVLGRGDFLEPSLNSVPRLLQRDALQARIARLMELEARLAGEPLKEIDNLVVELIPDAAFLKDELKRDASGASGKLRALVRLGLVRATYDRDAAAHLLHLGTVVNPLFDDPEIVTETGMTKEQLASLKEDLAAGDISPVNELRLKLLALHGKVFRDLFVRGDGHQDHPVLARTLFLLRLFENALSLNEIAGAHGTARAEGGAEVTATAESAFPWVVLLAVGSVVLGAVLFIARWGSNRVPGEERL